MVFHSAKSRTTMESTLTNLIILKWNNKNNTLKSMLFNVKINIVLHLLPGVCMMDWYDYHSGKRIDSLTKLVALRWMTE